MVHPQLCIDIHIHMEKMQRDKFPSIYKRFDKPVNKIYDGQKDKYNNKDDITTTSLEL